MKRGFVLLSLLLLVLPAGVNAQTPVDTYRPVSGKKAFALSLLLPGLGHRYANGGEWNAAGTLFAMADAGAWITMGSAQWQLGHYTSSFENLARAHAGARIDNQNRAFLLNIGQYNTSAEYIDFLLRARAWDRLDAAESPEQQWEWDSEANRINYRQLRSDADHMERRTTWVAAILVGNRFISALSSLRAVRKAQSAPMARFGISPGDVHGGLRANVSLRW